MYINRSFLAENKSSHFVLPSHFLYLQFSFKTHYVLSLLPAQNLCTSPGFSTSLFLKVTIPAGFAIKQVEMELTTSHLQVYYPGRLTKVFSTLATASGLGRACGLCLPEKAVNRVESRVDRWRESKSRRHHLSSWIQTRWTTALGLHFQVYEARYFLFFFSQFKLGLILAHS